MSPERALNEQGLHEQGLNVGAGPADCRPGEYRRETVSEESGISLLRELRSSERHWELGMINGPNMPNLGRRDRRVYGSVKDMAELLARVERLCEALGVTLRENVCSNSEAEILDWIHAYGADLDGIIINPAGLTTFGESTRHALEETRRPFVEVHFGNIARRGVESRFSSTAAGVCFGLRRHSYAAGVVALVGALDADDIPE